jgi:hypothetical protein
MQTGQSYLATAGAGLYSFIADPKRRASDEVK